MKRFILVLVVVLALVALGPFVMAQGKTVTVWCWDPNFNGFSMKAGRSGLQQDASGRDDQHRRHPAGHRCERSRQGCRRAARAFPDIALFQDYNIEQYIQNYPGAFVDLKAAGVDYSKFAAYKVGPMTDKGKIYGIPFDTGSTGYWLRTDMLKSAGLNPDSYIGKNLNWTQLIDAG